MNGNGNKGRRNRLAIATWTRNMCVRTVLISAICTFQSKFKEKKSEIQTNKFNVDKIEMRKILAREKEKKLWKFPKILEVKFDSFAFQTNARSSLGVDLEKNAFQVIGIVTQ